MLTFQFGKVHLQQLYSIFELRDICFGLLLLLDQRITRYLPILLEFFLLLLALNYLSQLSNGYSLIKIEYVIS